LRRILGRALCAWLGLLAAGLCFPPTMADCPCTAPPGPVALTMGKCLTPPCDPTVSAMPQSTLTWNADPCERYDVARGFIADLIAGRVGSGHDICARNNGSGPPYGENLDFPVGHRRYYYLARARNACGNGPWSGSGEDVVPWDQVLSDVCEGGCAPDSTCDDGAPCTSDSCDSSGMCRHSTGDVDALYSYAQAFGQPAYFASPALFDSFLEIFEGYHIAQDGAYNQIANSSGIQAEVSNCWGDLACAGNNDHLCISSINPDAGQPTDDDGRDDWPEGTVFYVGSTNTPGQNARTHVVTCVEAGTGIPSPASGNGCPVGTYLLTVSPPISGHEGLTVGQNLRQVWGQFGHPSPGGAYLLGYRLGYGSRLKDGKQGPNLLYNGSADASLEPLGWTKSGGTLGGCPYQNVIDSGSVECWQGTGSTAGITWTSSGDNDTLMADPVEVVPGRTYVLAGTLDVSLRGERIGLFDDREQSGVYTLHPDLQWDWGSGSELSMIQGRVLPFWRSWVVPPGVHSVRPGMAEARGGASWSFDDWSLREVTTWLGDDGSSPSVFLIDDPGTRNIVITGDSWADPRLEYGAEIRAGLAQALYERYEVDSTSQIFVTGQGGSLSDWILSNDSTNCNGSCWDARVATYHPLYLVVITGVNDANMNPPRSVDTVVANFQAIAAKCAYQGIIPIFVTPNPIGNTDRTTTPPGEGPGSKYERTHEYRDALRSTFLDGPLFSPCLP
jgi:hypothetical protein